MINANGNKADVVVKFVDCRYGVEAHRHCAGGNFAPNLHHVINFEDRFLMVVMDYGAEVVVQRRLVGSSEDECYCGN